MARSIVVFILVQFVTVVCNAQHSRSEIVPRSGLPYFFKKIAASSNDTIVIGYLGGSITEFENGWRDQTFNELCKKFPNSRFKQINAGVGGTGSDLGVFRLKDDILNYKPDLVFIEFAVNDSWTIREKILASVEGIIRQIRKQNLQTEICFIYTLKEDMLPVYNDGGLPNSVKCFEELANYYHIPSINLAYRVIDSIAIGTMIIKGKFDSNVVVKPFSNDGVHPYSNTGHRVYSQTVLAGLDSLKTIVFKERKKLAKHYFSSEMEHCYLMDIHGVKKSAIPPSVVPSNDTTQLQVVKRLPHLVEFNDTTQLISFCFTGTKIGFYDIMGPSSGIIKIKIDDMPVKYIKRFNEYSNYDRPNYFLIDSLSKGDHQVTISLSGRKLDKHEILAKRGITVSDSMPYTIYRWRVGKILLSGPVCK